MSQAQKAAKKLEGKVVKHKAEKWHAAEELRRLKKEHDADLERHEKEMVELRKKEVLSKTLAIEEFKSSNDYKEAVEKATSSYFDESFDLCKKKIGLFQPNLDIQDLQIDPNLVEEGKNEEKDEPDTNPLPNKHPDVYFPFFCNGNINLQAILIR